MNKNLKILICGFMGAGKSTFLKSLQSNSSSFSFTDLDEVIEKKQGAKHRSLGDYIRDVGIAEFRNNELETLKSLLERGACVISLGGGSLNDEAMSIISENKAIKLVYLATSFEVCLERIAGDKNRPLADQDKESLRKLYEARSHYYLKSDLILDQKQQDEITLDQLVTKLTN